VLQNNIIENNTLTGIDGSGAGAEVEGSLITCTGNEFKGNKIIGPMPQSLGGGGLALTSLKSGSRISGNTFINNESVGNGGGLYYSGTSNWYIIENNYFFNNSASSGGGLASSHSRLIFQNNVFFKNEASLSGGAIYLDGGDPADQHSACIINNSFSENSASTGGAITTNWVNPIILNSIFWQDSADLGPEIRGGAHFVELAYSNIDTSLIFHPLWEVILGEGMINEDPVFADTLLNLTMLGSGIDIGIDEVSCHNQTWTAPLYDIDYLIRPWNGGVDMGAHEYGSIPVGVKHPPVVSRQISVSSYPNPFADQTTIEYILDKPGKITLTIYDQIGQQVAAHAVERQDRGKHQLIWNAEGLPSGLYFYRLTAGNQSSTGKMVVVR
jgi:predicted outer membrane repeat protein